MSQVSPQDRRESVKEQFNLFALEYDMIKKKNLYYLKNLIQIFKDRITSRDYTILDIGCGTGEVLNALQPKKGIGVDFSPNMIRIAKTKYPNYTFYCQQLGDIEINETFDYIILSDVIEYIIDLDNMFRNIKILSMDSTIIIITFPNPIWSFFISIAELFNLKMKDKFSKKYHMHKVIQFAKREGFKIKDCFTRLFIPKKILFSDTINNNFYKFPLFRGLGLIQVLVLSLTD